MGTQPPAVDLNPKQPANSRIAAARELLRRGGIPIPVPARQKAPNLPGWQHLKVNEADIPRWFEGEGNIGLLLGEPSGGLVDVDLDCPEAMRLAVAFLPHTAMRHGRAGKPNSHWYYRVEDALAPQKFTAPDGGCLLELRSTGQQTIVPPSIHPSGEPLHWESDGVPSLADAEGLAVNAARLASAVLLLRYYPQQGNRNDFCLALAGLLVRGGMEPEYAAHFIRELARATGDEEWQERGKATESTFDKMAKDEPVRAGTALAEMLGLDGKKVISKIRQWLRLTALPANGKTPAQNQATSLMLLAGDIELFHDAERRAYATLAREGHKETWPVRDREFKLWLRGGHFAETKTALNGEALQNAIETYESQALFQGPEPQMAVRVAEFGNAIELDLANERWEAVEITPSGWRVVADPPVKFLRPRGILALPTPICGGSISELRPFLNLETDEDWVLVLAWLLAALRPIGPYPVLALNGEHGSAKSTTARVLRELIDPNKAALRALPRDIHELMIQASNARILCFDNLSHLPESVSDALSRIATGGAFSARELYSNAEETLFEAQRPILLNGIEDLCSRPDLQDRALVITLPGIAPERRKSEQEFWKAFRQVHPRILGALLEAAAAALRNLPTVRLEQMPRMADFARWATAAEPGLGLEPGAFLRAYEGNREAANSLTLESSPIAVTIQQLMEPRADWSGTATELLSELNRISREPERRSKSWPANARSLGNALRRIKPNLRQTCLGVEFGREPARKGRRMIRLRKIGNVASASYAASAIEHFQPVTSAATDAADANVDIADAKPSVANPPKINGANAADVADAKIQPSSAGG